MTRSEVMARRLAAQRLVGPKFSTPLDAVRAFGAMQAQDYLGALWALGVRVRGATEPDVERALADRSVVRTWPLRGTLHVVAADDARWMLEHLGPRRVALAATRFQQLGLDAATLSASRRALERTLRDGAQLTRAEVYRALADAKISTAGQRGIHIIWRLAHDGLLCFGPRRGKQHTFVLLDAWVPAAKRRRDRDEALAELARRYFQTRGPATWRDFAWWSGLGPAEARQVVASIAAEFEDARGDGVTRHFVSGAIARNAKSSAILLPPFDEYLVAYADRSAVLSDARHIHAGGGLLAPAAIVDGRVVGSWRRTIAKREVRIDLRFVEPATVVQRQAIAAAAERYGEFLGLAAIVR